MYTTPVSEEHSTFNWEAYFDDAAVKDVEKHSKEMIHRIRSILKEDKVQMTFSAGRLLRKLLGSTSFGKGNVNILELGAATGFLSRWLVQHYQGKAVLVDNAINSYKRFQAYGEKENSSLEYIQTDIFDLTLDRKFDIVCSFGLFEHFKDKAAILEVHKKFLKAGGLILILVPKDTFLTRTYFEVHPELNQGYRELLSEAELKSIAEQHHLLVTETGSSAEYVYDFAGLACTLKQHQP